MSLQLGSSSGAVREWFGRGKLGSGLGDDRSDAGEEAQTKVGRGTGEAGGCSGKASFGKDLSEAQGIERIKEARGRLRRGSGEAGEGHWRGWERGELRGETCGRERLDSSAPNRKQRFHSQTPMSEHPTSQPYV